MAKKANPSAMASSMVCLRVIPPSRMSGNVSAALR